MKSELRYKHKIKRKYFSGVRREYADLAIRQNFMQAFSSVQTFLVYHSFGTEADTHQLIAELLSQGKEVYLPRVNGKEIEVVPYGELQVGAYGIEEPVGQAVDFVPEVTVIPLLCVNQRGYRLGYGGGYYDRYLSKVQTKKVGLCYSFQMDEQFQEESFDQPLDMIICEKGVYTYDNQTN